VHCANVRTGCVEPATLSLSLRVLPSPPITDAVLPSPATYRAGPSRAPVHACTAHQHTSSHTVRCARLVHLCFSIINNIYISMISPLDCCWPSPAQSYLPSGLVEIHGQDFCSLLDMYVFRNGASSWTMGGVGLSVEALRLLHRNFQSSSVNCCWPSPAQSFLASIPEDRTINIYWVCIWFPSKRHNYQTTNISLLRIIIRWYRSFLLYQSLCIEETLEQRRVFPQIINSLICLYVVNYESSCSDLKLITDHLELHSWITKHEKIQKK
jgi:hypothetical protein